MPAAENGVAITTPGQIPGKELCCRRSLLSSCEEESDQFPRATWYSGMLLALKEPPEEDLNRP
jgi:hypothetical protein